MAQSVGEIGLDLVINKKQYDKQLKGITTLAKKAGATLAAAFTVKKLFDFGAQCVELGSDLAEVQNVVDVTFPHMTAQVDKFAKSAATTFGLSETMAKKFTGTFGAMAKAFGFSESAAYDMSTTLTGLAGDVASFYNISQDEAYTKLKSVFTGETETLKDLGVVMTQSALDAYALANGYGKTTQAMSEAEKVALRYAFVQNQLSAATGDFARTSDSWANQVRILSLQFDSLKATIGQGLINVFLPIIKVINTVIGKLMTLANAFKAFTELLTGKKSAGSQVASTGAAAEESLSGAAGAADNLAGATTGAGKAAKKAAKEMKALMGFDKINKLDDNSDSDSGSSGSGAGGGGVDFGSLADGETVIDKTDTSCSKLIERVKELADLCKKGFSIGFGDSEKNIKKITESCRSIKKSLVEIFTSPKVVNAANKWADSVAFNLGKIVGSVANVGVAIATNLTSGVAKSLEEKKKFIQEKIANLFTINAKVWKVSGNLAVALGDIISGALTSDAAINISSDIFSILTTGVFGGAELFAKAGLDLAEVIAQPFIDNKGKIEKAIENTLKPISQVIDTVKTAVEDAFSIISEAYDNHIAPMLHTLKKGVSDSFGRFLDAYNAYVAPVLQKLADKFSEVYKKHIKPCMEKIGQTLGYVGDVVSEVYQKFFKPFVDWCIATLIPILAPIFETLGSGILSVFGNIADAVSALLDVFKGITEFLLGIFTGDWDRAFQGLQTAFQGFIDFVSSLWEGLVTFFGTILEGIQQIFSPIVEWFGNVFSGALNAICNVFSGIGSWFQDRWSDICNVFSGVGSWFGNVFSGAWDAICNAFSSVGTFFSGLWNQIVSCFTDVGTKIGDAVNGAFCSAVNGVFQTIENIVNGFIKTINGAIGAINNVPGVNISKLKEVSLPRLAQGGYVKANAPQLAMIGDNRHQGEVVAPEDKLKEMALEAVRMAGSSGGITKAELEQIINNAVQRIIVALYELGFNIDGEQLAKAEKVIKQGIDRRFNTAEIV